MATMVEVNGIVVSTLRTFSGMTVYSAYEIDHSNHSTITYFDGVCYGRVGTIDLPAELDALPARSETRSTAVRAFHASEYDRAYNAILAAFPALANNPDVVRTMGEIEIRTPAGK